jgi:hypothetical protein
MADRVPISLQLKETAVSGVLAKLRTEGEGKTERQVAQQG